MREPNDDAPARLRATTRAPADSRKSGQQVPSRATSVQPSQTRDVSAADGTTSMAMPTIADAPNTKATAEKLFDRVAAAVPKSIALAAATAAETEPFGWDVWKGRTSAT